MSFVHLALRTFLVTAFSGHVTSIKGQSATASDFAALDSDAECSEDSVSPVAQRCSLNVLQRRGRKLEADVGAHDHRGGATAVEEAAQLHWQARQKRAANRRRWGQLDPNKGKWHGGGMVDDLPGPDQVDIMAARDADWHIGTIVYQVFVDRFVPPKDLNKKKKYIRPPCTLHKWNQSVFPGVKNEETKYYTNELAYWGGDLQGVISKLGYIHHLADVLYLQPIFKAYSSHKYDTSDYFEVDPEYGTLKDFQELADAVHARGMHLVLDGVFNHMGVRSDWFIDAMSSSTSPYRNWYFIGAQYGEMGYKAWQGGGTLAELRLETQSLQDTLWNSSDSVVATWLKRGADGFRLDVGTEIGREYLTKLTLAAHRHKYGSLIVGEVSAYPRWWTEAMDGILSFWMGWVISGVVLGHMGGVFAGMQIQDLIYQSSMEQVLRSWIIISNHDLPRLTSKYPDPLLRKFGVTLQFVLPGIVCIYYGEEISMLGDGDPFNRAPMAWENVTEDNEMYQHFEELVRIRRAHRSLRIGDFHQLMSFSLLAFIRRTDKIDEIVIVLANPTDNPVHERLNIPVEDVLEYTLFRDVLSNKTTRIRGATCQMTVPPHTAVILVMEHESGPNGNQYKRIYGHWDSFGTVQPTMSLGNSFDDIVDPKLEASTFGDPAANSPMDEEVPLDVPVQDLQ